MKTNQKRQSLKNFEDFVVLSKEEQKEIAGGSVACYCNGSRTSDCICGSTEDCLGCCADSCPSY